MESRIDAPVGLIFSLVSHFLMKVEIACAAARGLSDEARTGGLEWIVTTELTPGQFLHGVWGVGADSALPGNVVVRMEWDTGEPEKFAGDSKIYESVNTV